MLKLYVVLFTLGVAASVQASELWVVGSNTEPGVTGGMILYSPDDGRTWTTQYSDEAGGFLADAGFADAETGWAIGFNGVILATTNGGTSWTPQDSGGTNGLFQIAVCDTQTAWIAAGTKTVLRTVDGGDSWVPVTSPTEGNAIAISAVDEHHAWVLDNSRVLYRTTDAGESWKPLSPPAELGQLYDVAFDTPQEGGIVGQTGLAYSETAGDEWTVVDQGSVKGFSPRIDLIEDGAVAILNYAPAGGSEDDALTVSSADGESWIGRSLGDLQTGEIVGVNFDFVSREVGWIPAYLGSSGMTSVIARTRDAGATWTNVHESASNGPAFVALVAVPEPGGLLAGAAALTGLAVLRRRAAR